MTKGHDGLIVETFATLKACAPRFVTLRNFDLIPYGCSCSADIDVLVEPSAISAVKAALISLGYRYHPGDQSSLYLYNAKPHHHFMNQEMDVQFDIVQMLCYRSLDEGQFIPANEKLQSWMFERRIQVEKPWVYQPSAEDEVVHLCGHAIFDKRFVSNRYAARMEYLVGQCSREKLLEGLTLLLFRFSGQALRLLLERQAEQMYQRYLTFSDY